MFRSVRTLYVIAICLALMNQTFGVLQSHCDKCNTFLAEVDGTLSGNSDRSVAQIIISTGCSNAGPVSTLCEKFFNWIWDLLVRWWRRRYPGFNALESCQLLGMCQASAVIH